MLTLLILLPMAAAAAILLGAPARRTAQGAALGIVVLALLIAFNFQAGGGFQQITSVPIVAAMDLNYKVGVDGLSVAMLLLTGLVTVAALGVARTPDHHAPLFYACLLLISGGALGAFASLDLFFFYAFHEVALIPTFLLIGIWGSGDRQAIAWKITIYLALGSFVLLIGLIGLMQLVSPELRTFDIVKLQALASEGAMNGPSARWVFLLLLTGFGILISLFPFHTWAPQAYASAPAPAAMLHAGVLKKFGLYGLLRVALPLLPEAAKSWTWLLLILLVGNIIYVGLATIAQKRLDLMLGYSSVMHMGYIFLGLATFNIIGTSGAALLILAHGLSVAALFALAGEVRHRTQTLEFADLGGLAKSAPFLGFAFGMAAFASIGLPGFGNFASEVMIFFGAAGVDATGLDPKYFHWTLIAAVWGVVISAVYMLRAYRAVFLGELNAQWQSWPVTSATARWGVIVLLAGLLLIGIYPQLFLNLISPALKATLALG